MIGVILAILGVIILLVLIVVGFLWALYNGLIRLRNEAKNAWAQIDVQLKRRFDLIPNLMESVKGYMKHEKSVLENVTKARSAWMGAQTNGEKMQANDILAGTLKSLFAVSENYPTLKANENFMQLQQELTDTENKIAYARQHYNDMVMELNTNIQMFPNNMVAGTFGFTQMESYLLNDATAREPVKVQF